VPAVDGDSGDPTAALVREHLAVGADHVVVMLGPGGEFAAGVDRLERLVPVLR
jgi:hypothetical protein